MALYLEFCVIQICGMRPVHGRVEDFSKEFHALSKGSNCLILSARWLLMRLLYLATSIYYSSLVLAAAEGHAFLKESMNSLKQMVSFVYPELLYAEDML